jgi:uncharacterized protein YdhG (YjbR/CyaY superfamily)
VATTVDEYLAGLPEEVRAITRRILDGLRDVVPGPGETFSYQMPTVTMHGKALVYVGAWKKHIGLYPIPVAGEPLESQLAPYRSAKDTVRFPYAKGIPYELVPEIGRLLVARREAEG